MGMGGQEKGREGEGDKKCPLYIAFLESFYLIMANKRVF